MEVTPTIKASREEHARTVLYEEYLKTPAWRTKRNHALRLAEFRCSVCGSRRNLQVHHKSYERLGREWDQDLQVVCQTCHANHHDDVKTANEPVSLKLFIKLVSAAMHDMNVRTFSDISEAVKTQCAKLKIPYDSAVIGQAIAVMTGKHKPESTPAQYEQLAGSGEAINKSEAIHILLMLTDQQREQPMIREMPGGAREKRAHAGKIEAQVRQFKAIYTPPRRRPFLEELDEIFARKL